MLAPLTALAAAFAVVVLLIGPELIGAKAADGPTQARSGKQIFTAEGCGGCHTLADAGSSGNVGPNLDDAKPSYDKVLTQVTNGGGAMPPFKGTLTEQQIADVAAYVSSVAGK